MPIKMENSRTHIYYTHLNLLLLHAAATDTLLASCLTAPLSICYYYCCYCYLLLWLCLAGAPVAAVRSMGGGGELAARPLHVSAEAS